MRTRGDGAGAGQYGAGAAGAASSGAGSVGTDSTPLERARELQEDDTQQAAHALARKAARREAEAMKERIEEAHGGPPPTAHDPDAGLLDVARALLGATQESAHSAGATVSAFTSLVRADIALARASIASGVMLGVAGAVAGVTTWFLLVALLVVGLMHAGLALWAAFAVAALVTLLVAGGLALVARARFSSANLSATRRQWQMLRHGPHAGADHSQRPH